MKDSKNLVILFILSVVAFFSNLWIRSADLMEARNFITAREMIQNRSYIITTLNDKLRFEKPPLPTWLTAITMKLSDNISNETILRIPVAIVSIFLVFLIYYFVKEFTGSRRCSFLSAFISSTMFMLIKTGNENSWDMYTYVFSLGGILFLTRGLRKKGTINFLICGIFLTLSILSKGPVGIYGLFIPFVLTYIFIYGVDEYRINYKGILIILLSTLLLSSIWPFLVWYKYPDYFISVLKKEGSTWSNRHTESLVYYLDYFIYTGVWIIFSVKGVCKGVLNKCSEDKKYSKLIFLWNILVLVFISIIKMKKKRYGIPIYIISSFQIGVICNYYYNRVWSELKRGERIFFKSQIVFINIATIFFTVILLKFGYLNGKISILYLVLSVLFFCFLNYRLISSKNSDKKLKYIILGSGIFMIFVNTTCNWIIDESFYKRKIDKNYTNLSVLRLQPPILDIYSKDYEIEDVWRVGKSIKDLKDVEELPAEFILLGDIPEEVLNRYCIEVEKTYVKDDSHLTKLYYMKLRESQA